MTAEELYSIVSKWPEKYRFDGLGYNHLRLSHNEGPIWYVIKDDCYVSPDIAAALLCYHAEGVLMRDGVLWKWIDSDGTVGAECMGTTPSSRNYHESSKAPTRLAAIDALIRKVEGIG